jgi:hypothetical protein
MPEVLTSTLRKYDDDGGGTIGLDEFADLYADLVNENTLAKKPWWIVRLNRTEATHSADHSLPTPSVDMHSPHAIRGRISSWLVQHCEPVHVWCGRSGSSV